jgi:prepilin-type N-terminal cleavage/methylation domain-containing protein
MAFYISKKRIVNVARGFTLIEMLVSLSIFVVVTGLLVARYSNYNSGILLTDLAYEVALSIRQAQNNALNVREYTDALGNRTFNAGYGIHFDADPSAQKTYVFFADIPSDPELPLSGDRHYCIDSSICDPIDGEVTTYAITRSSFIKDFCVTESDGNETCASDSNGIQYLDVSFIRPNPEAIIATTDQAGGWRENVNDGSATYTDYVTATIVVGTSEGAEKRVVVQKTGQISIE